MGRVSRGCSLLWLLLSKRARAQGVGTIVGSAVFNICVIIGLTALCAGQTLQLWWYPLTRDSSVYGVSILLLVWAMADQQVTMFEASCLVATYVGYIVLMVFNNSISEYVSNMERERATRKNLELQVCIPMNCVVPPMNPL